MRIHKTVFSLFQTVLKYTDDVAQNMLMLSIGTELTFQPIRTKSVYNSNVTRRYENFSYK